MKQLTIEQVREIVQDVFMQYHADVHGYPIDKAMQMAANAIYVADINHEILVEDMARAMAHVFDYGCMCGKE